MQLMYFQRRPSLIPEEDDDDHSETREEGTWAIKKSPKCRFNRLRFPFLCALVKAQVHQPTHTRRSLEEDDLKTGYYYYATSR